MQYTSTINIYIMYTCTKLLSLVQQHLLTASILKPALDTINFPSLPSTSTSDHLHVYMYWFPLFLLLLITCKLHTCTAYLFLLLLITCMYTCTASLSSFYFRSLASCIHVLLPCLPSTSDHLHTSCTASFSSFYFRSFAYMHCFLLFLLVLLQITCNYLFFYCFLLFLLLQITCIHVHVLLPSLPSISDHLHTCTASLSSFYFWSLAYTYMYTSSRLVHQYQPSLESITASLSFLHLLLPD